jgi:hypothetical protein
MSNSPSTHDSTESPSTYDSGGTAQRGTIHHDLRIVPRSLSSSEQRVLAAFLTDRLSADRLDAELAQARSVGQGTLEAGAVSAAELPAGLSTSVAA